MLELRRLRGAGDIIDIIDIVDIHYNIAYN